MASGTAWLFLLVLPPPLYSELGTEAGGCASWAMHALLRLSSLMTTVVVPSQRQAEG